MEKKVNCFRCNNLIEIEKDDYYSFTTWSKGKFIKVDYAHKICWDSFLKKIGDTTEAMGIIRGLKNSLVKKGMLEQEEVVVDV